jgi:hypothetical protein
MSQWPENARAHRTSNGSYARRSVATDRADGAVRPGCGRADAAPPVQEQEGIVSLRETILGRHGHKPCLLVFPGSCGQSLARSTAGDKSTTAGFLPRRNAEDRFDFLLTRHPHQKPLRSSAPSAVRNLLNPSCSKTGIRLLWCRRCVAEQEVCRVHHMYWPLS